MALAFAQAPSERMNALFSQFKPREPGVAVLVIQNGQPVFRKGYGVTDLRTFDAITPETNFRLASLTKQFTAMAVMLLVHDGKLKYDDRLTDVFADFPAYGKAITIREVLNHTSGLLDYEDLMEKHPRLPGGEIKQREIRQIHDAEVLKLLKRQSRTKFAPGTRWDYSNSGYVLLAMAVEQRSGMSFGDFLSKRIFVPLGMTHTIAYEEHRNKVEHRAYGHTRSNGTWRETDQSLTSATLGDGGVYSSLNDLEKWDRALADHTLLSEKEMAPALLPPASTGDPLQTVNGQLAPLYGFGWFLDPYRGHRRYSHYGETVGFRNAIQRFPDDRLTVIVLSNRADLDAPDLAETAAKLFLKSEK